MAEVKAQLWWRRFANEFWPLLSLKRDLMNILLLRRSHSEKIGKLLTYLLAELVEYRPATS